MGPLLLLKVSLLLAVTLVAARLLNRAPATGRHGLWSLAFASLLLLAPRAELLPALHVPVPAGWQSGAANATPSVPASPERVTASVGGAGGTVWMAVQGPAASDASTSVDGARVVPPSSRAIGWPSLSILLLAAWLIGMMAAAATVLVSWLKGRRLVHTAEVVTDPAWRGA